MSRPRAKKKQNKTLGAVTETENRSHRRCVCGSKQDKLPRDVPGGLEETPDGNSDSDRQTARRKFAQRTADCDNASHRRFLSRYRPAATRRRGVESFVGQREIAREYALTRAVKSGRF